MKSKILIVEDNQIISENLERILRSDFEISRVSSAGQAIIEIDKKSPPDIILLDILLEGHSAFALLHELQSYADTFEIPIIICSNLAENFKKSELKNYGVVEILDKSIVSPSEILATVRRVNEKK